MGEVHACAGQPGAMFYHFTLSVPGLPFVQDRPRNGRFASLSSDGPAPASL